MPGSDEKNITLDTGDAGFDINGNLVTYDIGSPDAQSTPQQNTPRNKTVTANVEIDPKTGRHKDLSRGTKLTLSNYLSDLTKGRTGSSQKQNFYTIDKNSDISEISTNQNGYPLSPSPSTNNEQFAKTDPVLQGTGLNSYSKYYASIRGEIRKGAAENLNLPSGNELLSEVILNSDFASTPGSPEFREISITSPIRNYTSAVLKNNRFTAHHGSDGYSDDAGRADDFYILDGDKGKNTLDLDSSGKIVNANKMKAVGAKLSLRSSRELSSLFKDPNSLASELTSILPGADQLEIPSRFSNSVLMAQSALDDISDDPTINEINISNDTWGAMNNVNDPFSGVDKAGMALLSYTLVITTSILMETFAGLLKLILPKDIKAIDPNTTLYSHGILKKGKHYQFIVDDSSRDMSVNNLLGLTPVSGDYFNRVDSGLKLFFGVDQSEGLSSIQLLTAIPKALLGDLLPGGQQMGFNVITSRAIIRSTSIIATAFSNLTLNPLSWLGIVDVIRSSKLFLAVNIFAKLGEIATGDIRGKSAKNHFISVGGKNNPNPFNQRLYKDGKQTTSLVWNVNTTPNLLLEPKQFLAVPGIRPYYDAAYYYTDFSNMSDELKKFAKETIARRILNSRLPIEDVSEIENALDADYMPFSFHDLRTNEIISFHAFLASLTDGYTATYESTEAIGRVEPIKTYKGTHRKFAISFHVVATSEAGFDEMYRKLNKLVTLVYPQYTKGKQVTVDEKNSFIQPFSQLVGASPLIRIRLGDLIRSNYTRFALTRLFGYETDSFNLSNPPPATPAATPTPATPTPVPTPTTPTVQENASSTLQIIKNQKWSRDRDWKIKVLNEVIKKNRRLAKKEADDLFNKRIEAEPKGNIDPIKGRALVTATNEFLNQYIETPPPPPPAPPPPPEPPSESTVQPIIDKDKLTEEFFKPENNAVVKYFENNMGKGLAGVIESMDFDWFDKATWETEKIGSKAPMRCKVTINFSPIHDITPGIDYMGYNRAPVYSVGKYMSNDYATAITTENLAKATIKANEVVKKS